VTDFVIQDGKLTGLIINDKEEIKTEAAILAPGHSARDTFKVLSDRDLEMNPKAFAIGLRVEHPREMIDIRSMEREQINMIFQLHHTN